MKILQGGLVLGVAVAAWTFVMGFTGWYKHPSLLHLFWLVLPIQVAVLIWTLIRTKRDGRGWGGQVLAGFLTSAVGSALVFASSMVFTTLAFPRYFDELRALHEQVLRDQGMAEEQIRVMVAQAAQMQTSVMQATQGMIGTLVTGLFVSMLIAIWIRAKDAPAAPAT
ncbi:MAG: DUF4199 domain-containing protein [Deltaproteobacteria bacterium]|nr:DUF4199 domain-containing protein [Deltaproteobacteria bacterium]